MTHACHLISVGISSLHFKIRRPDEVLSAQRTLVAKPWLPNQAIERRWHWDLRCAMRNSVDLCWHSQVLGDPCSQAEPLKSCHLPGPGIPGPRLRNFDSCGTALPASLCVVWHFGPAAASWSKYPPWKTGAQERTDNPWLLGVLCCAWLELWAACQAQWHFHLRTGGGKGLGGQTCCINFLLCIE